MKKQNDTRFSRLVMRFVVWTCALFYAERSLFMADNYIKRRWWLRVLPYWLARLLTPFWRCVSRYSFGGTGYIRPNRKLRFAIYQMMLDKYKYDTAYKASLCGGIKDVVRARFSLVSKLFGIEDMATIFVSNIVYYPELEAYRPEGRRKLFWFSLDAGGRRKRIKILESVLRTKYTYTYE